MNRIRRRTIGTVATGLLLAAGVATRLVAAPPLDTHLQTAYLAYADQQANLQISLARLLRVLALDPGQSRKLLDHLVALERAMTRAATDSRAEFDRYLAAKRELRDQLLLRDAEIPADTDPGTSKVLRAAVEWHRKWSSSEQMLGKSADLVQTLLTVEQKQRLANADIEGVVKDLGVDDSDLQTCAGYLMKGGEQPPPDETLWIQTILEENGQPASPENISNVRAVLHTYRQDHAKDPHGYLAPGARELRESLMPGHTHSVAETAPTTDERIESQSRNRVEQYLLDVRMIPVLQQYIETSAPRGH